MQKILVIEDDNVICEQLCTRLKEWGYETSRISDFSRVTEEFTAYHPDLVLLDIRLPFYNGYHWCQEIRRLSQVPVIFVSSASDNMDIIMAMNMGGDDFIAKPFDLNVLIAKIQAVMRRSYDMNADSAFLEYKGLSLNTNDSTASYEGKKADLTRNEYKILYILMQNKGKIISRDQLMQRLWDTNEFIDDNTLTVNMTRLRRTLEQLGLHDFIVTKKGSGYLV